MSALSLCTHPSRAPLSSHPSRAPFSLVIPSRSTRCCGQGHSCYEAALRRLWKFCASVRSRKAAVGARDFNPYVHGRLRYYACTYVAVMYVSFPRLLCQPCYIGPRTWTGQQYCIRCLIRPGQNCICILLCPDPLTNSKHVSSGAVLPRVMQPWEGCDVSMGSDTPRDDVGGLEHCSRVRHLYVWVVG